jgi:glutathione S-transferase
MALLMAGEEVLLRNIVTKDKPAELLKTSPKGTVPVLILPDQSIIDESLDIMIWALKKNDPNDLLYGEEPKQYLKMLELIHVCDHGFRTNLSAYKKEKRYHLENVLLLRTQCEEFISELELMLDNNEYLFGEKLSLADLALLPFVRQFANVDRKWFRSANYPMLMKWLAKLMQSLLFTKAMKKYPLWNENHEEFLLTWD